MPRPPRIRFAGAIYHVFVRGVNREPVFLNDDDRRRFLLLLGRAQARYGWRIHAYCLMGTHFHLLVETPEPNVSEGMQWLTGVYAQGFNRIHGRIGHLKQDRFKSVLVESDDQLVLLLAYIARNPVRAGLSSRPQDYRWSSYRHCAGYARAPAYLDLGVVASYFGRGDLLRAQLRLREYVEDAESG
jgi:REP element-mobilizing transposase RayT